MEIRKSAVAGTLESSDVQIMLSAGNNGIEFELVSDVAKQFGDAIKDRRTACGIAWPVARCLTGPPLCWLIY